MKREPLPQIDSTLRNFFEKFELFADAPDAVAKLRELILQLAVTGNLVANDADDGAVDELLAAARAEQAQLVAVGAIRQRSNEVILPEELSYSLPTNWAWVCLSEIAHEHGQKIPDKRFTYIDVGAIDADKGQITDQTEILDPGDAPSRARKLVTRDTVIYSTVRPYLLNVAIVDRDFEHEPIASTAFGILHPFANIDSRYIWYWLRSKPFTEYVQQAMKGMAYPAINDQKFYAGPIALPPLAEQKRIVAKVDELMVLCDRLEEQQRERETRHAALARASLARFTAAPTPANLDYLFHKSYSISPADLRKAILTLAVQGKLVAQDPADEPAKVLLEQIAGQRAALAKEQGLRLPKQRPTEAKTIDPHQVPASWQWASLGQIALALDYGTSQKANNDASKIPVYRMGNILGGRVSSENLKYVDNGIDDLPGLYLKKNDLLFNRTNSFELVGKTAIFKGEDDAATFASYLIRIRVPSNLISADFINLSMNSPYFRSTQIEPEIVQQCGQANFNGTKLSRTAIPIPPLAEQRRIVAKVDQLMALVDQLETQLANSQATAKILLEAVVAELTAA